jgi:predicted RND superfamily exporter protein
MAFGIWGMTNGQINVGNAIVTTMALGIIVDDSVHFLSKYLRARREGELTSEEAVRYAFSTVGSALVVTSFVLVAGFLVLTLSPFGLNAGMGLLTAIVLVVALGADLLFLPPLLMQIEGENR